MESWNFVKAEIFKLQNRDDNEGANEDNSAAWSEGKNAKGICSPDKKEFAKE